MKRRVISIGELANLGIYLSVSCDFSDDLFNASPAPDRKAIDDCERGLNVSKCSFVHYLLDFFGSVSPPSNYSDQLANWVGLFFNAMASHERT